MFNNCKTSTVFMLLTLFFLFFIFTVKHPSWRKSLQETHVVAFVFITQPRQNPFFLTEEALTYDPRFATLHFCLRESHSQLVASKIFLIFFNTGNPLYLIFSLNVCTFHLLLRCVSTIVNTFKFLREHTHYRTTEPRARKIVKSAVKTILVISRFEFS